MRNVGEVLAPDSEWIIVHRGPIAAGSFKVGEIYKLEGFDIEGVDDPDEQEHYSMSYGIHPLYSYLPADWDFTVMVPLSMFPDRERFLIKMTGKIGKFEWESKVSLLDDIFESQIQMLKLDGKLG